MSVYMDEPFWWPGHRRKWSHLWADTIPELHVFAKRIGLKPCWFQNKPHFPHYDVTGGKIATATQAGAIKTTVREWLQRKEGGGS